MVLRRGRGRPKDFKMKKTVCKSSQNMFIFSIAFIHYLKAFSLGPESLFQEALVSKGLLNSRPSRRHVMVALK